MENKNRAFICFEIPNEIIKEITAIQEVILKTPLTGKITEPENIHLTLKFLGEISTDKLEAIKEKLKTIKFQELNININQIGYFAHKKSPKIIWLKATGKAVFDIQQNIDSCLSTDFPKEERFMSHITIARIKYVKDSIAFIEKINKIKLPEMKFTLNNFKLKTSTLKPLGPVYTTIEEYKCKKNYLM